MGQLAHCEDCEEHAYHEVGDIWVHSDGSSVRNPICASCGLSLRPAVGDDQCQCGELDLYQHSEALPWP